MFGGEGSRVGLNRERGMRERRGVREEGEGEVREKSEKVGCE